MNLSSTKDLSIPHVQAVCEETIPYLDETARLELVSYMLGIHTAFGVMRREEKKAVRKELNLDFPPEEVKPEVRK